MCFYRVIAGVFIGYWQVFYSVLAGVFTGYWQMFFQGNGRCFYSVLACVVIG